MTPDERQLITGLFDRMRQTGAVEKDRDAEGLIRDGVRQMPDAPYMLVQSVLVQEMALQQADSRIRELEDRVNALEAQGRPQQQGGGSFLGGLFGGGKPTAVPATAPRQSSGFGGAPGQPSGPWGAQRPGAMPMQQPQAGAGGGFMKTAMATAAGVAGGMLLANSISSMMNGGSSAQAKPADNSTGNQQAAIEGDGFQDAGQEQEAADSYDDGASSWDSGDGGGDGGGGGE